MMHRCLGSLPVLTGVLALVCARPSSAEASACALLGIEVAPDLSARWPELASQLREAFRARDDIDQCARSKLRSHDASISIEVFLPDGRSATRTVARREDVVPTLESLLLVPQQTEREPASSLEPSAAQPSPALAAAAPPSPPSGSPTRTRDAPLRRSMAVAERDAAEPSAMRHASRLRIELSVVTGGRVGDGQAGVGLGAFSFLELSGWLIGFEGRVDRYRTLADADPGSAGPARQTVRDIDLHGIRQRQYRRRQRNQRNGGNRSGGPPGGRPHRYRTRGSKVVLGGLHVCPAPMNARLTLMPWL